MQSSDYTALHGAADAFLRIATVRDTDPKTFGTDEKLVAGYANARLRLAVALGYPADEAASRLGGVISVPALPDQIELAMTNLALEAHRWETAYHESQHMVRQLREAERLRRINKK